MRRPRGHSGLGTTARGESGGWWDLPPFTAEETARLGRQRRRLRLLLGIGTAVLAVILLAPAVISILRPSDASRLPTWAVWVLAVGPAALVVAAAVVVDRRWQRPGPGLWLAAVGEPREVQEVVKSLRRGERIDGADRTLASAVLARQAGAAPRLPWLYLAITVTYLGGALLPSSPLRWVFAVLAILNAVLFFFLPPSGRRLADRAAAQGITANDPGPPWAPPTERAPEATS